MNETIKSIIERRSIRKFKQEQITEEELNLILSAGSYAPCTGGRQSPVMVVLQDKNIISKLGIINRQVFYNYFDTPDFIFLPFLKIGIKVGSNIQ